MRRSSCDCYDDTVGLLTETEERISYAWCQPVFEFVMPNMAPVSLVDVEPRDDGSWKPTNNVKGQEVSRFCFGNNLNA